MIFNLFPRHFAAIDEWAGAMPGGIAPVGEGHVARVEGEIRQVFADVGTRDGEMVDEAGLLIRLRKHTVGSNPTNCTN